MTNIFALTTRGLENVSAEEMTDIPELTLTETAYRRVSAECAGSVAPLLNLRTVDDVFIEVGRWDGIGHTRDMLALMQGYSEQVDLQSALAICASVRTIANPEAPPRVQGGEGQAGAFAQKTSSLLFSVSASFVGKRNYNAEDIKAAVANGVSTHYGWTYAEDDRQADMNIRLFIEHETAFVGVRLGKNPLHERPYKLVQRPASLKPPVAAAMLWLGAVKAGMRVLDPCCGAGTVLVEAAQIGAMAQGSDLDIEAVKAARANAKSAGVHIRIEQWDARHLRLPDHSIDRVVTNLPWGQQVRVDESLVVFYREVCREMERVVTPEGRIVVLTSAPDLLDFETLQREQAIEISLFGQRPVISVYSTIR
jgi:tRNA (guanine6-N2)-methyltransferase